MSARTFHVGMRDAVKSSTSKFANDDKSPALFMLEFGSETVVNSFRWLKIKIKPYFNVRCEIHQVSDESIAIFNSILIRDHLFTSLCLVSYYRLQTRTVML